MESTSSDQSLTSDSSGNESDATASSTFVRKQAGSKRSGQAPGPNSKRIRKNKVLSKAGLIIVSLKNGLK